MFHYRKLYADLVTEDGTVCVGYASWLSCFGFQLRSAGFELYQVGERRRVVRARGPVSVEHDAFALRLSFGTEEGPFSLALQRAAAPAHSAPLRLTDALRWRVLLTGAAASAHGLRGPAATNGTGYADLVEMSLPPRSLGLRSVEWGRGHVAQESFVFTRACFRDGGVFRGALRDGAPSSELELRRSSGDADLDLLLPGGAIRVESERVLHCGSALDAARFPSRAERALVRLCSGRVEETRWLARATFPSGASAHALHERVLMG